MKKIIPVLLLLLLCSSDEVESKGLSKLKPSAQRVLIDEYSYELVDEYVDEYTNVDEYANIDEYGNVTRGFSFNCADTVCCKRGRRGPRGPRGKRGPRGLPGMNASCGFNELFINAEMMFSAVVEDFALTPTALTPYTTSPVSMLAWPMPSPLITPLPPIGANFDLPVDIDKTQPIVIVIHLLVDSSSLISGNMANLSIDLDFKSNNDLVGTIPPAVAPITITSGDFVVTPATPPTSTNLRQISVSIPVDISTTLGDWAFIDVSRALASSSEFSGTIYLSSISIQYHRFC